MEIQTKDDAIEYFGTLTGLSNALGISKQAVSVWPDKLTNRQINEVTGAIVRLGLNRKQGKRSA